MADTEPTFNTRVLPAGLSMGVIPLCSICGAGVPPQGQEKHREWHDRLSDVLPDESERA